MSKLTKEYHQEVEEITELLLDKTKDVYQVVKKEADNINKKYKHAEVDMNQSISKILYEQKTKERKEKLAHLALSFVAHPLVGPALLGFFHHAKNNQPTKQVEETSSPKIKR